MTSSVRHGGPRTIGRFAVVLLAALVGWVAAASPASAHNVLRSTSPADGSSVDRVPATIVLTFDEPALALGTALVVTGPEGPVQQGGARLVDNTVQQAVGAGAPAGRYTVQWRVTSADGHPVSGTFAFTARAAGGAAASPATTSAGSSATSAASPAPASGDATPPSGASRPPTWIWLAVAAMLLLSALSSAAIARRRRTRTRSR